MRILITVCLVALFATGCIEPAYQASPHPPITLNVSAITDSPDTAMTSLVIKQIAERSRLNELSRKATSVAETYAIEAARDSLDQDFYQRWATISAEEAATAQK